MPKAVVSQDTERFDLKTLNGGFVVLRRLSYGEMLRRRDMMQTMRQTESVEASTNGKKEGGDVEAVFHVSKVTHFNFSRAVEEHNLEDEDGRVLNFASVADIAKLDPRIGGEIEDLIIDMNEPPLPTAKDGKELSFRGPSEAGDSPPKADSPKAG